MEEIMMTGLMIFLLTISYKGLHILKWAGDWAFSIFQHFSVIVYDKLGYWANELEAKSLILKKNRK